MSNLQNFLGKLGSDAEFEIAYRSNPLAMMAQFDLNESEKKILLANDSSAMEKILIRANSNGGNGNGNGNGNGDGNGEDQEEDDDSDTTPPPTTIKHYEIE